MKISREPNSILLAAALLCLPTIGLQATTLTNWARAGTATQSSTLDNANNPAASKAIDGNTSGAWGDASLTHTATGDAGEWWQVDLGEARPVGHIHLWFREDCCWTRNENLHIVLYDSANVTSRQVLWETNNVYSLGTTPRDIGFDLPTGLNGQVVFIEHVSAFPEVISLAEVEVFNQPLIGLTNFAASARGGVATSSSIYSGNDVLYGPQQAIDGNHMGLSGANDTTYNWGYSGPDNTGADPLPWWRVDLEAPQTVGSLVLWPRRDRTYARFENLQVTVADANNNALWEQVLAVQPSGPKFVISLVPPVANAKSVTIATTTNTPDAFLNLPEVEVFAPYASAPTITWVNDLQPISVEQNRPATLGPVLATVDGGIRPEDLSYRWYRNGVALPGIAGSWLNSYTTPSLQTLANNGDKYKVEVSVSGYGIMSAEVALTVTNDITAPTILTNSFEVTDTITMILGFSELIAPATTTNLANYSAANGVTVTSAAAGTDGQSVLLTLENVVQGDIISITVNGVQDLAGNTMQAAVISAPSPQTPINYARAGVATQSSDYNTDKVASTAIDGNTSGFWGDNAMSCTSGNELGSWEVDLLSAKTIGALQVYFRQDCCGARNRNIDLVIYDDPTNRIELLRVPLTGSNTPPNPTVLILSTNVTGRVVHLEHTADTDPADGGWQLCLAEVQVNGPAAGLMVTPDPKSWTVYAGDRVFLRSGASGASPIYTQWQLDGVDVPGATGPELVLTNITLEQGGSYTYVASNAIRSRVSQPAVVLVQPRPNLLNSLVARYSFTTDPGASTVVVDDAPLGPAKTAPHNGENSGATWTNSITDANNVTRTGVMWFDEMVGNSIGIAPHPDLNTKVGTIAFWMKAPPPEGSGNEAVILFDRRGGTNNWGDIFAITAPSGNPPGVLDDQNNSTHINLKGTTVVNDNNWHHIAYVYTFDPIGIISFYVDGQLEAESAQGVAGSWPLDQQLAFGQSWDSWWMRYNGFLDDIHIFNRVLSQGELAQIMSAGIPVTVSLNLSVSNGQLTLSWTQAGYLLQQTSDLHNTAGWSNVPGGASSPVTITPPQSGNMFYRLKQGP